MPFRQGTSIFADRTWSDACVQWVAAQPLSIIVVVVFVVILSGVVVVGDPGPSSSALPAALGVCTRRGSASGRVSAGRSTTGRRRGMMTTIQRMTTKTTTTICDNGSRKLSQTVSAKVLAPYLNGIRD